MIQKASYHRKLISSLPSKLRITFGYLIKSKSKSKACGALTLQPVNFE